MSYFSEKTILVTGATGLVGSHLVNALMNMGNVSVIALSRNEEKLKKVFASYLENPRFDFIAKDVSKPFDLNDKIIDVIFHAASPISGKVVTDKPLDIIKPNIYGAINCFEILLKQKIVTGKSGRIVIFSSATIYGNLTNKDIVVSEEDTTVSLSLDSSNASYFESKRMVEVITQSYIKQHKIDAVIVRPSYIYGMTASQPNTAFFSFLDKISINEDITINNTGLARRDNIYINDVVSGLLIVCEKGETGQAYNISSNAELKNFLAIDEIAELMTQIAKEDYSCSTKVLYKANTNVIRAPGLILDNTKLKMLGWKVTTSHADGIRNILSNVSISKSERSYEKD